jgi:hypothetical protein
MASYIGRRKLLAMLLGGAAAAWPLAARAEGERIHRIGVLMNLASNTHAGPRPTPYKQDAAHMEAIPFRM